MPAKYGEDEFRVEFAEEKEAVTYLATVSRHDVIFIPSTRLRIFSCQTSTSTSRTPSVPSLICSSQSPLVALGHVDARLQNDHLTIPTLMLPLHSSRQLRDDCQCSPLMSVALLLHTSYGPRDRQVPWSTPTQETDANLPRTMVTRTAGGSIVYSTRPRTAQSHKASEYQPCAASGCGEPEQTATTAHLCIPPTVRLSTPVRPPSMRRSRN